MTPPALPRLHAVTDDEVLGRVGWPAQARAVLEEGGPGVALHLRGPATPGRRLYELAGELLGPAADAGALLVVNDRIDVALALGIDAVQLGRRSLGIADARAVLGIDAVPSLAGIPDRAPRAGAALVGVSIHSIAEAEAAGAEGADWLLAGTVFATSSHPGVEGRGAGWVGQVVAAAGETPVIAIGGVLPGRVSPLLGTGAYGVAAIRGIWDASDPAGAAREYIEALNE